MNKVAKLAAVAVIAAPSFAFAGNMTAPVADSDVFVDTTPVAGGSSGSLGSAGGGAAVVLGLLALAALAASDGS